MADKQIKYMPLHLSDEEDGAAKEEKEIKEENKDELFNSLAEISEMCGQINSADDENNLSDIKKEIANVKIDKARYTCKLCHIKTFNSLQDIEAHLMQTHDLGEQTALFTWLKSVKKSKRLWRRDKDGYFHCFFCHHRSRRSINVQQHEKTIHKGEEIPLKNYLCKLCKKKFTLVDIFNHIQSEHKEQADSVGFVGNNLSEHYTINFQSVLKHSSFSDSKESIENIELRKDGNYLCGLCDHRFEDLNSFTEHFKTHENKIIEQNFKFCQECSYKTKSENGLSLHMRMHHSPKVKRVFNSCNLCGETRTRNAIHICQKKKIKKRRQKRKTLLRDEKGKFVCANCTFRSKKYQVMIKHAKTNDHQIQKFELVSGKIANKTKNESVNSPAKTMSMPVNGNNGEEYIIEKDIASSLMLNLDQGNEDNTETEQQDRKDKGRNSPQFSASMDDSFDSGPDAEDDSDDDWTPTGSKRKSSKDSSTDSSQKVRKYKKRKKSISLINSSKDLPEISENDLEKESMIPVEKEKETEIAQQEIEKDSQEEMQKPKETLEQTQKEQEQHQPSQKSSQQQNCPSTDKEPEQMNVCQSNEPETSKEQPINIDSSTIAATDNLTMAATESSVIAATTIAATLESPTPIVIQPPLSIEPSPVGNTESNVVPTQAETSPGDCFVTDYTEARVRGNQNQPQNAVPLNITPIVGIGPRGYPGHDAPRGMFPGMEQSMSFPRMAGGHAMLRMEMNHPAPGTMVGNHNQRMPFNNQMVNNPLQAMSRLNQLANHQPQPNLQSMPQTINIEPTPENHAHRSNVNTQMQVAENQGNQNQGTRKEGEQPLNDQGAAIHKQIQQAVQETAPLMTSSPRHDANGSARSPSLHQHSGNSTPQHRDSSNHSTPSSPLVTSERTPGTETPPQTSISQPPTPREAMLPSASSNITTAGGTDTVDLRGITAINDITPTSDGQVTSQPPSQPPEAMMTSNVTSDTSQVTPTTSHDTFGTAQTSTTPTTSSTTTTTVAKETTTDTGKTIGDLHKCVLCRVYFEDQAMHRNHMAHHGQTIGTCRVCNRMFRTPLLFMNHLHCSFQCRGIPTTPTYTSRGRASFRAQVSTRMPSSQPTQVMQRGISGRGSRTVNAAANISLAPGRSQGLPMNQTAPRITPITQTRGSIARTTVSTPLRRGRPPLNTYSPRQQSPMSMQQLQMQQRQQNMAQFQMAGRGAGRPPQQRRRQSAVNPDPNDVIVLD